MATGGLRVTPLGQQQKKLATRKQANPSISWGRCKGEELEDGDSWEVRAFAEDTSGLLGTTWPPRSYTCTFCRREFRSAQALGGHMNVHRRDRARLRGSPASRSSDPSLSPAPPALPAFSSPELVAGGGLCLFYKVPAVGAVFMPTASPNSTSSGPGNIGQACSCFPVTGVSQVGAPGPGRTSEDDDSSCKDGIHGVGEVEELDLELRLGR